MDLEAILRENISKTIHLSLGTSRDNKPWVSEVHFAYDEDLNLYFRSLASRRHSQDIATNPQVAGTIVRQHGPDEYPLGIYFEGAARLLPAGAEQEQAFTALHERFDISEDAIAEAARPDGHQFYKMIVDTYYVFGKFGDNPGQKYTINWRTQTK